MVVKRFNIVEEYIRICHRISDLNRAVACYVEEFGLPDDRKLIYITREGGEIKSYEPAFRVISELSPEFKEAYEKTKERINSFREIVHNLRKMSSPNEKLDKLESLVRELPKI